MFIVEVILLLLLTFGSYYARRLDMDKHHIMTYTAIIGQVLVFTFYMRPRILFLISRGFVSELLIIHAILGLTTIFLSLFLAYMFLKDKNDYDLTKLRYTRPIMILTYFMWLATFTFGTIIYFRAHILR